MATAPKLAPCEASLLRSLSAITMNPSGSRSSSRPRTNDDIPSQRPSPKYQHSQGHRRVTVSGLAPTLRNSHRSQTSTACILKSHNDADSTTAASSQTHRVSFSSRKDRSIDIASFDVNALPQETRTHRSLRDSMNWPPPPPPRTSSTNTKKPFAHAPAPPRPRPARRHSTMEIEEPRRRGETKIQEASGSAAFRRLPFSSRRKTDGDLHPPQRNKIPVCSGMRSDYSLGEDVASRSDMISPDDPQAAFIQVSRLKLHNFAFIKRTDGSWTYALLAHRYFDADEEECMMFVLQEDGSKKTIKKRQWASFVRAVANEKSAKEERMDPYLSRNISMDSFDLWVDLQDMDDCSMISFTSN